MADIISRDELPRLFACLAPYSRLVLGVSGGADSLCLMHLVRDWRDTLAPGARPDVLVVTIDHRLRAASSDEAADVAGRTAALGLQHKTLAWTDPRPESGLQAEARELRYRLFEEVAGGGVGRAAVVVAHTEDDQAETLIMRLKRGSGVDGLASMASVRRLSRDIDLVRPLLGVSRARIEATLHARGVTWITDPSNENPAFERVRIRMARTGLDALGLSNDMLSLTARRLQRARAALEAATRDFLVTGADLHEGVFASMDRDAFMAEPEDIRIRATEKLIHAFGDVTAPALLSQVEALVEGIATAPTCRMSLGGAMVSAGEACIRVYREGGRLSADPVSLSPGERVLWDGRFWVSAERGDWGPGGLTVAPLMQAGSTSVDATLAAAGLHLPEVARDWPKRALQTLPGIWTGSRLIGVPHLDQAQGTNTGFRVKFRGLEAESS